MRLRPYQSRAVDEAIKRFATDQRTLIVVPTGGGKTVIAGHIAKAMLSGGRVMLLAHRDELIRQGASKFAKVTGILPAIEKAEEKSDEDNMHGAPPIVASSIQTQISGRGNRRRMHKFSPSDFSFVFVDEAHHATADSYRMVIDHYASNPNCKILGVTATADRADGEALGQIFQSVAFDYELPDIISDGYLVPIRQRSVQIEGLDFSKVRTLAGDLNQGDLESAMCFERPLHGVAHATIEIACGLPQGTLEPLRDAEDRPQRFIAMNMGRRRKTLVFAVSVAHAERLAEIFNRWLPGSAAHVDGQMSMDRRRAILKRYSRGEIQYLVNCMVATEGFDEPGIELVVMARPTKSRALYSQMAGRGTRPSADLAESLGSIDDPAVRRSAIASSAKPFLEVLDFVGNSGRHRLVTTVDILGVRFNDKAIEIARKASERGSVDVTEALKSAAEKIERQKREAEEAKKRKEQREIRLVQKSAARRASLVGTSTYRMRDVDPLDRFSMRVNREKSASHLPPNVVATLRRNKVDEILIGKLDEKKARTLAGELIRRHRAGLCTFKQAKMLQRHGLEKDQIKTMTKKEASERIDAIAAAQGWRRKPSAA